MSEMVERVVRAMMEEFREQAVLWEYFEDPADPKEFMMRTGSVADLTAVARAAIAAMREPTEEMAKAGLLFPSQPADREFDPVIGNDLPVERYKEMIDAALA